MFIDVFIEIDKFVKVGQVEFQFDRVIGIDLKIPVESVLAVESKSIIAKPREYSSMKSYKEFSSRLVYPFTLQKLSKAELAFKEAGLTHQLFLNNLEAYSTYCFYITLTTWQRIKIAFHQKQLVWQTADFRTTIYRTAISHIFPLLLGTIGAIYFFAVGKDNHKQDATRQPSNESSNFSAYDSVQNKKEVDSQRHYSITISK